MKSLDFFTKEKLKFLTQRMGYFWWKNLHLSKVLEGCSRRMFTKITAHTPDLGNLVLRQLTLDLGSIFK